MFLVIPRGSVTKYINLRDCSSLETQNLGTMTSIHLKRKYVAGNYIFDIKTEDLKPFVIAVIGLIGEGVHDPRIITEEELIDAGVRMMNDSKG